MNKLIAKLSQAGLFMALTAGRVYAQVPTALQDGIGESRPDGAPDELLTVFRTISNTLILLVGAIAVIMLVIGGFRYVVSSGNPSAVEGAKNTILYAIIGIVVAILAFAAVNFVVERFASGGV